MKRYKSCYVNCMMQEHPKGDWCRYEDVPGWVSVEERWPDFGVRVLVTRLDKNNKDDYVIATREPHQDGLHWVYDWTADKKFSDVVIRDQRGYLIGKVRPNFKMIWIPTHWQPLPNPPEKDDAK